jgi:hypothetical protein
MLYLKKIKLCFSLPLLELFLEMQQYLSPYCGFILLLCK